MSTDDRDLQHRAALAPFLEDARNELEAEIAKQRAIADVQDAVARAHAMDPSAVPQQVVHEAGQVEPVVLLGSRRIALRASEESPDFAGFLSNVRGTVDGWADRRMLGRIPVAPHHPSSKTMWWTASLAIAGVLVVGFFGVMSWRQIGSAEADRPARQAVSINVEDGTAAASTRRPGAAKRWVPPSAAAAVELEPAPEPELQAKSPPAAPSNPRRHRPTLDELERDAQVHWRRGDVKRSEDLFNQIIRRFPRTPRAELAFGDLFTIAYQFHDKRRQAHLWRRYLGQFPKGRYADDASAGLCRVSASTERSACWARYLENEGGGRGGHHQEALRGSQTLAQPGR
ncbi:MAG: hypothetical protein GY946_01955 [bacterium]|nr:hypothetical protein [bacterium]